MAWKTVVFHAIAYLHPATRITSSPGSAGWCLGWGSASWIRNSWWGRASGSL